MTGKQTVEETQTIDDSSIAFLSFLTQYPQLIGVVRISTFFPNTTRVTRRKFQTSGHSNTALNQLELTFQTLISPSVLFVLFCFVYILGEQKEMEMSRQRLEELEIEEILKMMESLRIPKEGYTQVEDLRNKLREHLEGSSTRKIGEVSTD